MKQSNAATAVRDTEVTLVKPVEGATRDYPAYIGLDVHANTIAWAVAHEER